MRILELRGAAYSKATVGMIPQEILQPTAALVKPLRDLFQGVEGGHCLTTAAAAWPAWR